MATAFVGWTTSQNRVQLNRRTTVAIQNSAVEEGIVAELRSKSVRELKKELQEKSIPCNDVFEKEELVQRLSSALLSKEDEKTNNSQVTEKPGATKANDACITTPLKLISLRGNEEVTVASTEPGTLKFQPTDQPFATMDLNVSGKYSLCLMVDTACSGIVLKSSSVKKHNIPVLPNPVTSTGASGQAEQVGLAEIPSFSVGGTSFGRLPAAVQDLEVIPQSVDGIIGLSFLGQFETVQFDYRTEQLQLYKEKAAAVEDNLQPVASGSLNMLGSMGVYTVNVYVGERGPVSMIVDTGGSNTFLSWKGLRDLGLTAQSKGVYRIPDAAGAMGNTGQAFALTHRIFVSSQLHLGQPPGSDLAGLSLAGNARLGIDIGDIPLLQNLASQNVGGILGLDVFTRCAAIRLSLQGRDRKLTLYADKTP